MKKIIFFTTVATIIALVIACNKEPLYNSKPADELGVLNLRSDPPNYTAFEDTLNKNYVDTPKIVQLAIVNAFSFTHTDGFISSSEQDRIIDSLDDITGGGVSPQFIDINILEDSIYVVSDGNPAIPPNFPDDIRPDGGLSDGQILVGTWCDNSADSEGGGCGRVARAYASSLSLPDTIYYYKDIRYFSVVGDCTDDVTDDWSNGIYEVSSTDFWHWKLNSCTNNGLHCLDATDLEDQLDILEDIISDELPTNLGHEIIGLASGRYYGGIGFQKWNWFYYLYAGVPVTTDPSS